MRKNLEKPALKTRVIPSLEKARPWSLATAIFALGTKLVFAAPSGQKFDPTTGVKTIPECSKPIPAVDYAELKKLVIKCNVMTIEALLPLLPTELRRNFTFMRKSESSQRAGVSPWFPRTILFNSDGSFFLAFTSDPERPESRSLEIIEYKNANYEFHRIEFPYTSGTSRLDAAQVKKNHGKNYPQMIDHPTDCMKCHGADPHPIWKQYPFWPGAYGAFDDTLIEGTPERKDYETFLRRNSLKGTYSRLIWPHGAGRPSYQVSKSAEKQGDYSVRNNTRMSNALAISLTDRMASKILRHPEYPKMKYKILSELIGCVSFDRSWISRELQKAWEDEAASLYNEQEKYISDEDVNPHYVRQQDFEIYADPRYSGASLPLPAIKHLGIIPKGWLPSLHQFSGQYNSGRVNLTDQVLSFLLDDLAREDPEFRIFERAPTASGYERHPELMPNLIDLSKALRACPLLEKKGKAVSANESWPPDLQPPLDPSKIGSMQIAVKAASTLSKNDQFELLVKSCGVCHRDAENGAFKISDEKQLRKLFSERPEMRQNAIARINSEGETQMPPGSRLSEEIRKALSEYLRNFK